MIQRYTYAGRNRRGVSVTGDFESADSNVALLFVKSKYEARWQWLTIDCDGLLVGGITKNSYDNKYVWWADSSC